MSTRTTLLVILVLLTVAVISYLQFRGPAGRNMPAPVAPEESRAAEPVRARQPTPVALNRGPEVLNGFTGPVHPLLFGRTSLKVTAQWTPVGQGRDRIHRSLHPLVYSWFTKLEPQRQQQTYTNRDFSAFLPVTIGEVGQLWALDADKMVEILMQFHPHPSLQLVSSGRRAGPDGAFAILRAISPSHLDIVFRIHAEFYMTPDDWPSGGTRIRAWYTPAYFAGRVLVNQRTGTVEHFHLALATEKALNVHLTVDASAGQARDVVRVERMELAGGDDGLVQSIAWTKALTRAEAQQRLAKVFFKFLDIDWVPLDQVLVQARSRNRPIFAVVSWGAFEDQSC
jgi:hypothetical protein